MIDRDEFIRYAAQRDAERDQTNGVCDPGRARERRTFDDSCREIYEQAYIDRHRALSGSEIVLDQLRTAGLL